MVLFAITTFLCAALSVATNASAGIPKVATDYNTVLDERVTRWYNNPAMAQSPQEGDGTCYPGQDNKSAWACTVDTTNDTTPLRLILPARPDGTRRDIVPRPAAQLACYPEGATQICATRQTEFQGRLTLEGSAHLYAFDSWPDAASEGSPPRCVPEYVLHYTPTEYIRYHFKGTHKGYNIVDNTYYCGYWRQIS